MDKHWINIQVEILPEQIPTWFFNWARWDRDDEYSIFNQPYESATIRISHDWIADYVNKIDDIQPFLSKRRFFRGLEIDSEMPRFTIEGNKLYANLRYCWLQDPKSRPILMSEVKHE